MPIMRELCLWRLPSAALRTVLLVCVTTPLWGALCLPASADATPILTRDFDVVSLSGIGFNQTASGTSNGIGWVISPTHFSSITNITGTFTGFSTMNFVPPVAATDMIHVGGNDFMITFESFVTDVDFYLRENDGGAGLNFGIVPTP